jgi:hypothetical protein
VLGIRIAADELIVSTVPSSDGCVLCLEKTHKYMSAVFFRRVCIKEIETIQMDSKVQSQSRSQKEGQQATSAPTRTNQGRILKSSVVGMMGEATAQSAISSTGVPPADVVTLFQVLELMERDLEEERATSQALREENDELVNDNHELVDHQKELESQLKQTNTELGSLGQENQEMQKELERLQGRQLDNAWGSNSSLLVRQKVQDKTKQMQQRARATLCDTFIMEDRLRSLQQELNKTHTAAETLLKQRNEFESKTKKLQKHMKKCSCQDTLVFIPDCNSFVLPGSLGRRRPSLPDFLATAANTERPCAGNTPARAPAGKMVPRCLRKMMSTGSMSRGSRARQQYDTSSGVRRMKLNFDASKIHQQPADIASPAGAAKFSRASHRRHGSPSHGEEGNFESCLRNSWRLIKKRISLGAGGSGVKDVGITGCIILSQPPIQASGEDKHLFVSFKKSYAFGCDDQAHSQDHHQQGADSMMVASLALSEHGSIPEKGQSQEEKKEDEQFENIGPEQEKDTERSRQTEKSLRRHGRFARRTPASSLHSDDSQQGVDGTKDTVDSIVLGLAQEMGIPCGHDATDHKEALREVLAATSAPLAFDDFPQDSAANEKYQAAPASVRKIPSRGASNIQSHEKKTGYTRWSNEYTSGTWLPTDEELKQTKMKQAAY